MIYCRLAKLDKRLAEIWEIKNPNSTFSLALPNNFLSDDIILYK